MYTPVDFWSGGENRASQRCSTICDLTSVPSTRRVIRVTGLHYLASPQGTTTQVTAVASTSLKVLLDKTASRTATCFVSQQMSGVLYRRTSDGPAVGDPGRSGVRILTRRGTRKTTRSGFAVPCAGRRE
jgi:hypothetical protein